MSNKKVDQLCDAMHEARRFLTKADAAITRLNSDELAYMTGSKELAAAKRASMDLSRALTEIRKS